MGSTSSAKTSKPPVSDGGMTLKPSAAPFVNHSVIRSATCSGVPATTQWPRAPANRCSSWRIVGRSRSTMSTTSRLRLLFAPAAVQGGQLALEPGVKVVAGEVHAEQPMQQVQRVGRLGELVELGLECSG